MATENPETNQSWGGRFSAGLASDAASFSESQSFDRNLYKHDIRGSQAHAAMLGQCGIITREEAQKIHDGLEQVLAEIETGNFNWQEQLEDVHMNIENRLVELIGETGKKLHTGRSRNDQVALAYRMYVGDKLDNWRLECIKLCRIFCDLAKQHRQSILPGLTHFQPAQPVSLAQHFLAYANMFKRDAERIADALSRTRISPLGAAALAGTTYPLRPEITAEKVGFPQIFTNSMDAVADRDFVLEALFCASVIAVHMSRLCEELIIWSNPAFAYVALPDDYSTGSSIMPQKKNPDMAELIRGKTGRIIGDLMGMLVTMKSLPLTYNRDMQEDKEGFFDTDRTILSCMQVLSNMLAKLKFNSRAMALACKRGFINATELADYLVAKGIPFRDAHHITGQIVAYAEKQNKSLEDLQIAELQALDPRIESDIYRALDYNSCVKRRETPGGTGPNSVCAQLAAFDDWFAQITQ